MPVNTALRDYLLTRRSVGLAFLQEPGPDAEQLRTILTIGTRVPDHGKLAPWRLILIEGEARAAAGEKLAQLARGTNPAISDAQLDNERRQFLPAPLTIGVVSAPQAHPKIPVFEQLISAGNVAFNLVNGAYAMGFAAQWVSRWFSYNEAAASMLGARDGEQFVGFVHIGTPVTTMEDRPRPNIDEIVSRWQA